MSQKIFYMGEKNPLIPFREYYTLLARNILKYPHYSLVEIDNTREYAGIYKSYYITGYGDNRCGHYVFINNEKYNTIDDDYCGHRAFSLVRFIPEKWVYNINVCENYLIYNSLNIKNALISLSSYIRYNALLNIDCLFIILNFYYFPQHLICEIKSFIINAVSFKKICL